jgi:enoyl-CoA hydratase/carnithine racemase
MEFSTIAYEVDDGIAIVTLNREEVHNAFNQKMQEELRDLWRSLRHDDGVRSVVLTGKGTKAFCAGIDRSDIPVTEEAYSFDALTYEDPGGVMGPRAQGMWKPVIAAVNGMACGGAFYLLGESDIILAAEHATFFDPHVTYSMAAVFEPALLLARMPFGEVVRMTLTGADERLSAARAYQLGLVSEIFPSAELLPGAIALAKSIASKPPAAVQASLRALWAARQLSPHQMQDLGNLFLNLATSRSALEEGQAHFATGARPTPKIR